MTKNRFGNLRDLDAWAWSNLKELRAEGDRKKYEAKLYERSLAFYLVSDPTAKNYAKIITYRHFSEDLPEIRKPDYMICDEHKDNLPQDMNAGEIIDSMIIKDRLTRDKMIYGDVALVEENIPTVED